MNDLLNLKLKYAEKEWKNVRRSYRTVKKEVDELFSVKTQRFRKII